jgi:hypothetical protein
MAVEKISPEARKRYVERIREYKVALDRIETRARELESGLRGAPKGQQEGADPEQLRQAGPKRFQLAVERLNQVSYYCLMHALSVSLLGVKNEGFLNEARKSCYKSIIHVEEAVSPLVDAAFSEYEAGVQSLGEVSDAAKHEYLMKLGFAIDSVAEGFGANSKWKWSFVELEGRYAVISRNLLNLKTFLARQDPRIEGYAAREAHINLAKRLLQQSADRYREKYELVTQRLDDFKQAILLLAGLRRLHVLLGEQEPAEVIKRKIDVWKAKMEDDQRKREQELATRSLRAHKQP